MAIASVGTLGTGVSSTSASSFTLATATNTLSSGNFGILTVVTDNRTTTDGVSNDHTSVSGGTGKWRKLAEYTNGQGAAGSGITTSVWFFEATGTVSTGTTITISLSGTATDKAASFWKFTKGAGTQIMLDTEPSANGIGNVVSASNGFGSVAFSGLSSASRLYFRGLGKEASSTTALTVSTGFSQITNTRSRNNTNAVSIWGEFRINTSTGETSNPTLAVSGDTAGAFLALKEVTPATTAPTADNFDDNSVTGWNQLPFYPGSVKGGTIAEANQRTEITPPTSSAGINFASRVTPGVFDFTSGSGLRAFIQITPGSIAFRQQCLISVGPDPLNHYAVLIDNDGSTIGLSFTRWINGGTGGVGSRITYDATNHAWLSIRHGGSGDDTVYAEYASSSGANPPSSWTLLASEGRQIDLVAAAVGFSCGTYFSEASPVLSSFDGFNGATSSIITYNIAAGLSGSGTLSGSVIEIASVSTTLSGAGNLNASIVERALISTTLSGSGTLSANIFNVIPVATSLSGNGTIAANISDVVPVSSTLSGSGNLTSAIFNLIPVASVLAGSATLTTGIVEFALAGSILSGTGNISGTITNIIPVATTLNGSGAATTNADQLDPIAASLTATGTLTSSASIVIIYPISAVLTGSSILIADAFDLITDGSVLTGTGTLSTDITNIVTIAGSLSGASAAVADTLSTLVIASGLLATGTVIANVDQLDPESAVLTGAGTLTGSIVSINLISTLLSGAGTINGNIVEIAPTSANLTSTASLDCSASILGGPVEYLVTADLSAMGTLTSSIETIAAVASSQTASGTLNALALNIVSVGSALNGAGTTNSDVFSVIAIQSPLVGDSVSAQDVTSVIPVMFSSLGSSSSLATLGLILNQTSALTSVANLVASVKIKQVRRPIRQIRWI